MSSKEHSVLSLHLGRLLNVGLATRFVSVGVINTIFGYSIILVGLFAGLDDIAANLLGYFVGFPFSYVMHRYLTFQDQSKSGLRSVPRYAIAVVISLLVNLAVVVLAGALFGLTRNPLVHLVAVGAYAATLYVCTATFVFTAKQK